MIYIQILNDTSRRATIVTIPKLAERRLRKNRAIYSSGRRGSERRSAAHNGKVVSKCGIEWPICRRVRRKTAIVQQSGKHQH
ncbi:hypothetical protein HN51_022430 [Arachis hypogaea]